MWLLLAKKIIQIKKVNQKKNQKNSVFLLLKNILSYFLAENNYWKKSS